MTNIIRPDFPEVIDSSIRETFFSCPHKAFRMYFQHWKANRESINLVAGAAFAKGLEVARTAFFVNNISHDDSVALGVQALLGHFQEIYISTGESYTEELKNPDRMAQALEFYLTNYPLGGDGLEPAIMPNEKLGIEFSFVEELPVNHPVTGKPILFAGRADMVANYAGGLYLVDEKTTKSLGPTWPAQWDMRGQFSGYVWACRKQNLKVEGVIVRGVSILKTKFDHLPALTIRSPHETDLWFNQFVRDIKRMLVMWEEGYFDYALGEACTTYGGCMFKDVCRAPEDHKDSILEASFTKRVWDPLTRKENPIDISQATKRDESEISMDAEEFLGIKLN